MELNRKLMSCSSDQDPIEAMRRHIHTHVTTLAGPMDTSVFELIALMRMVMSQLEANDMLHYGESGLSGQRFGILLLLAAEEHRNSNGLTPTLLSKMQRVSKNTMSALLSRLEKQGLIQRTLDEVDKRLFRIQLTPAGRELVKNTAPQRLKELNELANGLSSEERQQLITLLSKLYRWFKKGG